MFNKVELNREIHINKENLFIDFKDDKFNLLRFKYNKVQYNPLNSISFINNDMELIISESVLTVKSELVVIIYDSNENLFNKVKDLLNEN